MVIELSIALIAIAFIALVIYLIIVLRALRETLSHVDPVIRGMRLHLEEIGDQAKKAIEQTNQISCDLKQKMESLSPIFQTFSNVGEILENKTSHLKKESLTPLHRVNQLSDAEYVAVEQELRAQDTLHVADILELASVVFGLWRKIKHKYAP